MSAKQAKQTKQAQVKDSVRLAKDGQPFRSEDEAKAFIKTEELSEDIWGIWKQSPDEFQVVKLAEMLRRAQMKDLAAQEEQDEPLRDAEAAKWNICHMVTFGPATSENERKYVPLAVNGIQVQVPRNVATPLPLPLIEAAQHAVFEQIESLEGREFDRSLRRTGEFFSRFGLTVGEQVPIAEFHKLLKTGTARARHEAGIKLGDADA